MDSRRRSAPAGRFAANNHDRGLGRQARRGAGRPRLARHARRNARYRNPFGVPAARRDRRARPRAQRRRAARGRATPGGTLPLPFAGGSWVVWERGDDPSSALDGELPIHRVPQGDPLPSAALAARRALGWWLVGTSRAMLSLARQHAMDRVQFGRPIARFRRSGIGWPRRSSRSRAPRRPWTPPAADDPTSWPPCWPRPRPARRR